MIGLFLIEQNSLLWRRWFPTQEETTYDACYVCGRTYRWQKYSQKRALSTAQCLSMIDDRTKSISKRCVVDVETSPLSTTHVRRRRDVLAPSLTRMANYRGGFLSFPLHWVLETSFEMLFRAVCGFCISVLPKLCGNCFILKINQT